MDAIHKNSKVKDNLIALTFDDGPHPEFTAKALKLLKDYNAKASFFCIGKNAEKYPELVENILSEGHVIGNHSYSHINNYGFLSSKRVLQDIQQAQEVFNRITNLKLQFFRPPFGVTNPNIAKAIKELKLKTFGWQVRSFDTVAKDPDKVFRKISAKIQKGDIILLHDSNKISLEILEKLLQFLENKKFKSVTLESLFNLKAYAK
jgi:peptidoglycan/xylan/chitin deacetylase (PgdA/CDA1 family)